MNPSRHHGETVNLTARLLREEGWLHCELVEIGQLLQLHSVGELLEQLRDIVAEYYELKRGDMLVVNVHFDASALPEAPAANLRDQEYRLSA